MRFITEMGYQEGYWLVVDTENNSAIVGTHQSATLAALDAFKREEDSCLEIEFRRHYSGGRIS